MRLCCAGKGSHAFGWRDLYDVAVRWRQVADPYDPVFYADGLSQKTFEEGIVLGTHMLHEEMRVNKYYSQVGNLHMVCGVTQEGGGASWLLMMSCNLLAMFLGSSS